MGVMGRRTRADVTEPAVYQSIDDILKDAESKGFINNRCLDIDKVIKSQGIDLIEDSTLPATTSGYLRKVGAKWVIGVNKSHHVKRRRFTMAHEFAHYMMHRNDSNGFEDNEIFFRNEESNSIEYAANRFASELLMPTDVIRELISAGINTVTQLSDVFNVSSIAVKIRVSNLGYKFEA